MTYEKLGQTPLDYAPCRYGASKLLFRGPRRRLGGRYAAFVGGTETYGKFIARPFPALVEARSGVSCVNLGWSNAGIDVFQHDPEVIGIVNRSRVCVMQVLPAQNMSNRFYTVHPRRNDRFVAPSAMLRALYRDVDFTEFHFTRHLLHRLQAVSEPRFALVRAELQAAWVARMKLLLDRIEVPVVLLWMSGHAPGAGAEDAFVASDPAFVTAGMLDEVRDRVAHLVDATASREARAQGTARMVFSPFEAAAAAEMLGPAAHEEAADALCALVGDMVAA